MRFEKSYERPYVTFSCLFFRFNGIHGAQVVTRNIVALCSGPQVVSCYHPISGQVLGEKYYTNYTHTGL